MLPAVYPRSIGGPDVGQRLRTASERDIGNHFLALCLRPEQQAQ